jgi:hypothetical protein
MAYFLGWAGTATRMAQWTATRPGTNGGLPQRVVGGRARRLAGPLSARRGGGQCWRCVELQPRLCITAGAHRRARSSGPHDVPEAAQADVAELRPRGGAVGYGERRRGRWRHREEKGGWEGQCEREWGGKLGFHCYLYEMKIYIGPIKIGLHLGPTLWVEVTTHALSTYRDGAALNTIDRA